MEFEQLIKRLDWLDDELRKYKTALEETRDELSDLESENKTLRKKVKELTTEFGKLSTAAGRMQEFDSALVSHRKEINNFIADLEKKREAGQVEVGKRYRLEFDSLNKPLSEIPKVKESIAGLRRELKSLNEEEMRRNKAIAEAQAKMENMVRDTEAAHLSIKASDANRLKEGKKLADLQGEVGALRKRAEETREKVDIAGDNLRRMDVRIGELSAGETERRQSQTTFIETQTRLQIDRERDWKTWQLQIDSLGKHAETIEAQLQKWETAQRAVKHARETYEEITAKFERRINEITEIQRLGEDRFRQEWVTFKADDHKRWTGLTLTQDETRKDLVNDLAKLEDRITSVEDLAQTLQDVIQQTRDVDEQMLQAILAQIHELLSAYERIKGTA